LKPIDFSGNPARAASRINHWTERQTRRHIRESIPPDGLDSNTRLVLVNAIYLKACWLKRFSARMTDNLPFHTSDSGTKSVPTMMTTEQKLGFAVHSLCLTVTIPYAHSDLHFLVLLPNASESLGTLEKKLPVKWLAECARLPKTRVRLYLPRLNLRCGYSLKAPLCHLGMRSAFDDPRGSANFHGIAPRRPEGHLALSEVYHQTFLELDEEGTKAAATTAVTADTIGPAEAQPSVVHVDRPFLFAVQHRPTGTCLFLGRVADPQPTCFGRRIP